MPRPVIFVHGAFCGGWAFDGFRQPFEAAGYQTHTPTLPGHERGDDLQHLGKLGVRDYADAIVKLARAMPAAPILVGHSLGGLVAQLAAARGPCSGLVLLAPSAPWGVLPTTLDEHGNSFGLSLLGDYWHRPVLPDYAVARQTSLDRLSRDEARHAFSRFVPESGRAVLEAVQWWLDHTMASAAPVYKITAPVLGVAGSADRVNAASTVRRIVNRFPSSQASFQEMPKMSHWLVGEPEWPDLARLTLDWLSRRGLTSQAEGRPTRRRSRASDRLAAPS